MILHRNRAHRNWCALSDCQRSHFFFSFRPFAGQKVFRSTRRVRWSVRRKTLNCNRFQDMRLKSITLRAPQGEDPFVGRAIADGFFDKLTGHTEISVPCFYVKQNLMKSFYPQIPLQCLNRLFCAWRLQCVFAVHYRINPHRAAM